MNSAKCKAKMAREVRISLLVRKMERERRNRKTVGNGNNTKRITSFIFLQLSMQWQKLHCY